MQVPRLCNIYIYPVKSLTGIRAEQWPVTPNGLQYDRHWMLVDDQQQFLSQRRIPQMALMTTAISASQLIISAPGMEDLCLGLTERSGATLPVQIWEDKCTAHLVSIEADRWFSHFLQMPCRLVFQSETDKRQVDPAYALPRDQTSFSDGFPFLIIAENSLTDLNSHLPVAIDMTRFRPNLVISDCPAYAEDTWREISINAITFRLPKPCSRCVIPTIDPIRATYGKEPLQTLNRLRKANNKVYFGQNALHNNLGTLCINSEVTILRTGLNQPLL